MRENRFQLKVKDDTVLHLWATPIFRRQALKCGVFNKKLERVILHKASVSQSCVTTNVGAWRSDVDPELWQIPEMITIQEWILDATESLTNVATLGASAKYDFRAECWALIYRAGDYQKLHNHRGSVWSGVYYIAVPECDGDGGCIEFIDPRWAARPFGTISQKIKPCPGLLLVFPSWLQHLVHPVEGKGARICIAFNVGVCDAK